ncbi:bacteriophytochrome-like histidine kinase sensor with PAS domains [Psychroflexus torquis ATCC 700755]|uniref:histidine kinase n=1 Tax=Psychroflexus torquis (strain ATCC 700755 / CIP 106069 / ACAM 623) TaxID=313595 RepID=K4IH44_PSYTT|nr:PAS domain S-box protein [Psychroflexus torquis]AFU68391.1 bacteriophytochrome-like histidine kinase sensor with PAS domains [Psychroflexus torquis ATCC 700755]
MSKPSYKELEMELIALKENAIVSSKELSYKEFFDNMADMVNVIELIYDTDGQPIDFYNRATNICFSKFFGKTQEQLVNKKISSIVDVIEDNWFTSFASVDKTGEEIRFKSYGAAYDKFYRVTAWKISKNRVGISMSDITEAEKAKIELKKNLKKEQKERSKTEYLLKEKRVELQENIYNLNSANTELAFQNNEKEKRANELILANTELAFQNNEKQKRADELAIANTELAFQNKEKQKRADELAIANTELAFQNKEKDNRADELILANKEKQKRADELVLANKEKQKRANELILANKELAYQTELEVYRFEMEHVAHDLTLLIDTANAPIFGIDSRGLVNEWNQTSEKITGFTKDEVLGKDLVQNYITKEYRESVKKVLDDALLGQETANYEFPLFAKDGQRVMVLLNSSTRRDAKGEITGVLGVGQDITELDGYRNELELKVNERTLKLNQALEKQKELNELKSRFVSTASHEFRTPLSSINFAAGSIKKYWSKMEPILIQKKLDKIEDQVLHMTKLLDDILIVGKAEAGKIIQHPVDINIGDFMSEIIDEVSSACEKSHDIKLIDAEGLKMTDIFIDEKSGRNIFINLIGNAVKYSPTTKNITVALSSEKKYTVITITDYGIGISKSELKTIFKPFSRGKNVDLIQGTGLGLTIVKEAIDAIGGKIIVNSTLGNGTSFIIKILKKQHV